MCVFLALHCQYKSWLPASRSLREFKNSKFLSSQKSLHFAAPVHTPAAPNTVSIQLLCWSYIWYVYQNNSKGFFFFFPFVFKDFLLFAFVFFLTFAFLSEINNAKLNLWK